MNPAKHKGQYQITQEWEQIADLRAEQIAGGKDLSFSYVLLPSILELSKQAELRRVVEIGCGPGFLANELAKISEYVVGLDMSSRNIQIAKRLFGENRNLEFVACMAEEYSLRDESEEFTLAVANMTLMTTLNLDAILKAVRCLLRAKGDFVFTITHPCFWPIYWGYAWKEWFVYEEEIPIEAEFKISLDRGRGFLTTHIHRPLGRYVAGLGDAGFSIKEVREPMPTREVEARYPEPWRFPRFLAMRCKAE